MIPKLIHYCWFGGKPIPPQYQEYIESWKKYLPDYEIRKWDESNFDINCCEFTKSAAAQGKWAFVSDYARFYILEKWGVYFDTDVEVIKDMSDIITRGAFFGEQTKGRVAAGLGMAVEPGHAIYREVVETYNKATFEISSESSKQKTVVQYLTDILAEHGYSPMEAELQVVEGITIYPPDYFNPKDYKTGLIHKTKNTRTIHHFAESWKTHGERLVHAIEIAICRVFGANIGQKIAYIIVLPYAVINRARRTGLKRTLIYIKKKIIR